MTDPTAPELRAVAPIVTLATPRELIGAVTLVSHGDRIIGVTSAELLRPAQTPLAILTKLDGSSHVPVASWFMGRYAGIGLVELGGPVPVGHDVVPLDVGSVSATISTHGAPAALVAITEAGARFERTLVPVYVDADDAGGMSDRKVHLASPLEPAQPELAVEGAPAFAWMPPEPALGKKHGEVVLVAIAFPYRAQIAKPRDTAVLAELLALDDLGRALVVAPPEARERPELGEVHGEIEA